MKINLDDPKLTAYALGELSEEEQVAMRKSVESSPEAQAFVQETEQVARLLRQEFRAELEGASPKPFNIMPLPAPRSFWSDAQWLSIGFAASLAICALLAAMLIANKFPVSPRVAVEQKAKPNEAVAEFEMGTEPAANASAPPTSSLLALNLPADLMQFSDAAAPPLESPRFSELAEDFGGSPRLKSGPVTGSDAVAGIVNFRGFREEAKTEATTSFNTAGYDHFEENPFLPAATNPLSTFSIDVDTASYANVRRMINAGTRPPKDAVRIEEMINYFAYDYPQPQPNEPFSINLEMAGCPWQPEHRLVRIGLKGREIANDERGASNLVFLLDVSGSMDPANRLPLIQQSMRLLVERLTENDRVAIVVYAGASGLALPSTTGDHKERIISALENLKAGGSTNGAAGIELAYKIAAENFIKGGVNRVILATDGDFNVGVTGEGELVRLAEEKAKSGVFLTVLGVGDDNLKDSMMQKLADKGNGNYAYLDSLDEARKVLVQQMNGTLVTIAKDVKVQVEFNPARVASYRLLGYEKRMLRKEDFNNDKIDAGEIGAGHTVTALYEVVPVGAVVNPAASAPRVDALKYQGATTTPQQPYPTELLTVKLRHKKPDGDKSELIERSLNDNASDFAKASPDFRFAAAVAEFGMILRDSPYKGDGTLGAVLEWAQQAKGRDDYGYRAGFVDLVQKAQTLAF